jgi:redox-sensitive bicupin YhaK (pirin superfamily)
MDERQGNWLHMVSPMGGDAPIKIHQDANLYSSIIKAGEDLSFEIHPGRQAYGVLINGVVMMNGAVVSRKDGFLWTESIKIEAVEEAHLLVVEMSA